MLPNPHPAAAQAIIVEECMKTGGIGASLSAVIHESLFNELDHEVGGVQALGMLLSKGCCIFVFCCRFTRCYA